MPDAVAIKNKLSALIADGMTEREALSNVFDRDDTNRVVDNNGWWEVLANPISCVGVYQYLGKNVPGADPDKIVSVFRPPEELGHPDTLESIRLLPWIDDHLMLGEVPNGVPAEHKGIAGVIGEKISFDGRTLWANIKMFSKELADLIASGKKALSLGYRCKYEYAPGTFEGMPYEYVQRVFRGNHLATVDDGRMGDFVSVLDSQDNFTFTFDAKDIQIMADENQEGNTSTTPGATDTPAGEMSVTDAIAAVTALLPILQKLAGAVAPAAAAEVVEETDEEKAAKLAAAAATDEETEEEKAKRLAAGAETSAMDARITKLERLALANTPAALAASFAKRDQLAAKLTPFVGTFDHSAMTEQQVAAYGIKKLNLAAPAGAEAAVLAGYMQAATAPAKRATVSGLSNAMDSKDAPKSFAAYNAE